MKLVKKIFDTNANITNIKCEIENRSNNPTAIISLENLGRGVITAIKFNATGYNSFGDIVPINGKKQFYIVIQDLVIEKNAIAKALVVNLPNSDIRRLSLEECQICYDDGTVVSYLGSHEVECEIEEYDEEVAEESELLVLIRDALSEKIKNLPKEIDSGWICGCGRYNETDNTICSLCGLSKKEVFMIREPDFIDYANEQHKVKEEERKKRESIETKEKSQKKLKKIVAIVCFFMVGVLLITLIGHSIILSKRRTYRSEQQMKTDLQGVYTYYSSRGNPLYQILIEGDTLTYCYDGLDDIETTVQKWDYRNGKIETFEKLIITKEGNILDDTDKLYLRGGTSSKKYSSQSTTFNYESGFSVLELSADPLTYNSSYIICTGSVKNTGKKTYKYVEVKGAFKDSGGSVIDTDWTYAVGSEGLAPGESSTFRLSVPKNSNITSCNITLKDFDW